MPARERGDSELRRIDGQPQVGRVVEERFERHPRLHQRKLSAEAEMRPEAEPQMVVRRAFDIEPLGIVERTRVEIRRPEKRHHR